MTIGKDRYRQVDIIDGCTENTRIVTQGSSVSFVLFIPAARTVSAQRSSTEKLLKGMCKEPPSEGRSKNRCSGMSGQFHTCVFRINLSYRLTLSYLTV
jgi:hypothetical protein